MIDESWDKLSVSHQFGKFILPDPEGTLFHLCGAPRALQSPFHIPTQQEIARCQADLMPRNDRDTLKKRGWRP